MLNFHYSSCSIRSSLFWLVALLKWRVISARLIDTPILQRIFIRYLFSYSWIPHWKIFIYYRNLLCCLGSFVNSGIWNSHLSCAVVLSIILGLGRAWFLNSGPSSDIKLQNGGTAILMACAHVEIIHANLTFSVIHYTAASRLSFPSFTRLKPLLEFLLFVRVVIQLCSFFYIFVLHLNYNYRLFEIETFHLRKHVQKSSN